MNIDRVMQIFIVCSKQGNQNYNILVTPKPRSSNSIALKSSRHSSTPLIRDVFKQDAKRKRVKSPQAFTSADSMHVSDDSLSVSSIGSFVDSSDKRLADFCDDHCESTCKS